MQRMYKRLDNNNYYWGRIDLAKSLGCSATNITNIQKGRTNFTIKGIEIEEVPFAVFPDEIWAWINDDYKVSSYGRVARCRKNLLPKLLTPKTLPNGYQQVQICKNGKRHQCLVHRLVAEAFIPNPESLPQINHKNKRANDNKVSNLEWCSAGYNNKHARLYYLPLVKIKKIALEAINNPSMTNIMNALEQIEEIVTKETKGIA